MRRETERRDGAPPPANDNRSALEPPVVRALRRRPGATYATSDNVILPLAFAARMTGWGELPSGLPSGPADFEGRRSPIPSRSRRRTARADRGRRAPRSRWRRLPVRS